MKQEPARNHKEAVNVNIAHGDLAVIGHVLLPYARFIRFVIPPSRDRGITLTIIENLRRRITDMSKGGKDGEPFPLTTPSRILCKRYAGSAWQRSITQNTRWCLL